eukprot:scaffold1.g5240.t1
MPAAAKQALLVAGVAGATLLLIRAARLRLARHRSSLVDRLLARLLAALLGDVDPAAAASTVAHGLPDLIGNTPLVRINSLSEQTGCEILAKAEFLNPGGSIKDRVALEIIQEALAEGRLAPGGLITEGTVGSTGVSLAMCAAAHGCRAAIYMPDDVSSEKEQTLAALGAEVVRLRPVSITNPDHFVCRARRRAASEDNAIFADQFETVFLIDPPGSSLYNKVTRGVLFTREEAEGRRLKHPYDTITEGIGLNRLTQNFSRARIDGAFKGSDAEAVEMAQYLLRNDGLFVGSSAAMNCVGAVKAARQLGPGHTIVTVLCDGGHRHLSKFHSPRFLEEWGLTPQHEGSGLSFVVMSSRVHRARGAMNALRRRTRALNAAEDAKLLLSVLSGRTRPWEADGFVECYIFDEAAVGVMVLEHADKPALLVLRACKLKAGADPADAARRQAQRAAAIKQVERIACSLERRKHQIRPRLAVSTACIFAHSVGGAFDFEWILSPDSYSPISDAQLQCEAPELDAKFAGHASASVSPLRLDTNVAASPLDFRFPSPAADSLAEAGTPPFVAASAACQRSPSDKSTGRGGGRLLNRRLQGIVDSLYKKLEEEAAIDSGSRGPGQPKRGVLQGEASATSVAGSCAGSSGATSLGSELVELLPADGAAPAGAPAVVPTTSSSARRTPSGWLVALAGVLAGLFLLAGHT